MADEGSSNAAIVAIVIIALIAIGLAFFLGLFNKEGPTKIVEKPTVIESPVDRSR